MKKIKFGDLLECYRKECTREGTELLDQISDWTVCVSRSREPGEAEDEVVCIILQNKEDGNEQE